MTAPHPSTVDDPSTVVWHALTAPQALQTQAVDPARGLDGASVAQRAALHGPNAVSYTHLTLPTNREV